MGFKQGQYGFDEITGYPLCKIGHVRSPGNVGSARECLECKKIRNDKYKSLGITSETQKRYANSEKGKACRKKYRDTSEFRLKSRGYEKKYMKTEAGKALMSKRNKKSVRDMAKSYISSKCGLRVSQLTDELIEIKRLKIQLERTIKCQKLQQAA